MGNIESFHQIVAADIVKKVVDKELYDDFMKKVNTFIEDHQCSAVHDALNEGDFWDVDDEDEAWKELDKAYEALCDDFEEKTGMTIYYVYLSGDGDCYDDLDTDEWYWELDESDVWLPRKMTDKAKAFQEKYGAIDTDQRHSRFG
jgi:hypothetical protein